MHMPIAEEAVRAGRHLVTASYTSPAMRDLHEKAKEAGVVLLNEVGLDPGIDHMLIMQSIDSIHERGGQVTELVSLCGGIPDPVAADNPLLYKFSWSPRGVLTAARNSAQFLQDGVLNQIDGPDLLKNANASNRFPTMRLEVLPNRNSLEYRDLYNVPKVATICRGTFRYEGWANVMIAFKLLGLMELDVKAADTWSTYLSNAVAELGETDSSKPLYSRVQAVLEAEKAITDVPAAMHALTWLGLISQTENTERMVRETPLDSLCSVLEEKLQYKENERDMVAMFHTVVGTMPDGTVERHTSRLLDFGVTGAEGDSAMSKTVGYTTGAAAELLLYGDTSELSPGVMIPTTKEVYTPLLNRLQDFGITWNESIEKP
jgi:saccharopine dehydrogenase-like NADP-dependent oxidoreductase